MNNLKKVLALGLALVMLLGMFTIASAEEVKVATQLSDWDSIEHKNAVALNVDLGIIKGMPDGSYAPAENIDRASWAKLAYIAATGDDDADAYLGTVSALKDVAGNWAESYISFLAANKYISGNTDGNYLPNNNVTVVEACKTMLTILGYNAKDRGYENNEAWSGKIMSDAKANGLMNGVDQTALQPLTRDNAAQIIYNALQARYVEEQKTYDQGIQYVARYDKFSTLGYKVFGLVKLIGIVDSVNPDGTAMFDLGGAGLHTEGNHVTNVNAGKVNSVVKASLADVGQICEVFIKADAEYNEDDGWFTKVTPKALVSATVARAEIEPLKTLTAPVNSNATSQDFALDASWDKNDDANYVGVEPSMNEAGTARTLSFYVNGDSASSVTTLRKGDVAKLYDTTDDGKVDTIIIEQYKVAKVNAVTTKTESGVQKVSISGVTSGFVPADQINGAWQDLSRDDVVLYYTNGETGENQIVVLELAQSVTGKVTAVSNNGDLTVNGKNYPATGINSKCASSSMNSWSDYDNEYTFYLDKNGGVCEYVQNTDEAIAGNVAVVLESKWLEDGDIDATGFLRAKLMFLDGSVQNVRVSKIGVPNGANPSMRDIVEIGEVEDEKKEVEYTTTDATADGVSLDLMTYESGFFSYRVDSNGYYELSNLCLRTNDWDTTVETVNGHNSGTLNGIEKRPTYGAGNSANTKTIFMVEKRVSKNDVTYGVYTGYANVPAISLDKFKGGVAIHEIDDDTNAPVGAAKYVFLTSTAFADDVPEGFIYLRTTGYTADVDGNYTMKVVNNKGEETTMLFTENAKDTMRGVADNGKEKALFIIETINDGVVEDVKMVSEGAADGVHAGTLTGIGDGVVTIEGAGSYEYDTKTVMILIDLDKDTENNKADKYGYSAVSVLDPEALDMNSEVYPYLQAAVVVNRDDVCDYLYVIRGVALKQDA